MGEGHAVRKNDSRGVQCSCVFKSAVKRVCTLPWDARVPKSSVHTMQCTMCSRTRVTCVVPAPRIKDTSILACG